MRYKKIDNYECVNGVGNGMSLFVQGCDFHCKNCFNPETWNPCDGDEWTQEQQKIFLDLASRSYIDRISFLGGDPLHENNIREVHALINQIRFLFGCTKTIWLYTGYTWEEINNGVITDDLKSTHISNCRKDILNYIDVLVDGRYVDSLRDVTLKWKGSSNQRVIDVKKTLETGEIVLWA